MKCATSTLHEQLARQPGIFMSEPKEPNFFSDDEVYARGPDWYAKLFEAAGGAALRGESSTHYTKLPTHPRTLERMQRVLPDAKLIYMMRHPIDRLISQYMHEWSMRNISCPLDRALDEHPELVSYSQYHLQITPVLAAYGPSNVLPVFMERLLIDPQAELVRVCQFLRYPGAPQWQEQVGQQNASSDRLRLGSGLGRALFEQPQLAELRRKFVPKRFRDALKSRLSMQERPVLSDADRTSLSALFDADLAQLGKLLGEPGLCSHAFKDQVTQRVLGWAPTDAAVSGR